MNIDCCLRRKKKNVKAGEREREVNEVNCQAKQEGCTCPFCGQRSIILLSVCGWVRASGNVGALWVPGGRGSRAGARRAWQCGGASPAGSYKHWGITQPHRL